eukprot:TRINITY_DN1457_c0_g1_i2.p1 TRINITY_DN1457_c0_g1~~TRINITY_DN1457_c0_g1_i2.p1  ORF type:complete len:196 (+),score=19.49 TRINITY_DN1457_c0_g1_i2:3-590(+)
MSAPPPPPNLNTKSTWRDKKLKENEVKQWSVSGDTTPISIDSINWEDCIGFSKTSSNYVIIAGFNGDKAIVLRAGSTILSDCFANDLGVELGVPVPKHTLVKKNSPLFDKIYSVLSKFDKLKPPIEQGKHELIFTHPFIMIMEFIGPNPSPLHLIDKRRLCRQPKQENDAKHEKWRCNALYNIGLFQYHLIIIDA